MDTITATLASIEPKDVFLLLVGALTTVLVRYLPGFVAHYSSVSDLLGIWYGYHWTRLDGRASFRSTKLIFKRSLYGIRIHHRSDDKKVARYRGRVSYDGDDILLLVKSSHGEYIQYRLPRPIPHGDAKMVGLVLAIDYDREKYASVQLCSQNAMSEEEAKVTIAAYADFATTEAALRLRSPKHVATLLDHRAPIAILDDHRA